MCRLRRRSAAGPVSLAVALVFAVAVCAVSLPAALRLLDNGRTVTGVVDSEVSCRRKHGCDAWVLFTTDAGRPLRVYVDVARGTQVGDEIDVHYEAENPNNATGVSPVRGTVGALLGGPVLLAMATWWLVRLAITRRRELGEVEDWFEQPPPSRV